MKRTIVVAVAVLGVWACGQSAGSADSAANDADTLTRRQKDSIIATLPIPGSRGVGRALDAQDASRERAAALDSILAGR